MSTTLKIGQSITWTAIGSDGSTVPLGTLSATTGATGITVSVNPSTNVVTVTAVATGGPQPLVTFSAPGFLNAQEIFVVTPLPQLVVTPGPITGP